MAKKAEGDLMREKEKERETERVFVCVCLCAIGLLSEKEWRFCSIDVGIDPY